MRIVAIFCQISLFFRSRLINMIEAIKPIDGALLVNEDTQPAKYGKELRLLLEEISQNYDHLIAQSAMVKDGASIIMAAVGRPIPFIVKDVAPGRTLDKLIRGRSTILLHSEKVVSRRTLHEQAKEIVTVERLRTFGGLWEVFISLSLLQCVLLLDQIWKR
jgi:transketolase C-terminal domain/subunit